MNINSLINELESDRFIVLSPTHMEHVFEPEAQSKEIIFYLLIGVETCEIHTTVFGEVVNGVFHYDQMEITGVVDRSGIFMEYNGEFDKEIENSIKSKYSLLTPHK